MQGQMSTYITVRPNVCSCLIWQCSRNPDGIDLAKQGDYNKQMSTSISVLITVFCTSLQYKFESNNKKGAAGQSTVRWILMCVKSRNLKVDGRLSNENSLSGDPSNVDYCMHRSQTHVQCSSTRSSTCGKAQPCTRVSKTEQQSM